MTVIKHWPIDRMKPNYHTKKTQKESKESKESEKINVEESVG